MRKRALDGIRIIDFSMVWAGPLATRLLGDMGAEVIKIESHRRTDSTRRGYFADGELGERPYNRGGYFHQFNHSKYGITLDLTHPAGIEIAKDLVKTADVVIENFTPRVMEKFGLGYETLRKVKPDVVMMSMPGFGLNGPYRDFLAYGQVTEPMVGLPSLQGYRDGPPMRVGLALGDAVSAFHGALAVLLALRHRRLTGVGQFIELGQRDLLTRFAGEAIMEHSLNGRGPARLGNRHPSMAPHGCYRCKGKDKWVTIAVSTDAEWEALCRAMGAPEWTGEGRFADALSRWEHQDELDGLIEAWTGERDHREAMDALQREGVPAGAVLNGEDICHDPQVWARGAMVPVDHSETGPRLHRASPIRFSKTPSAIERPAPCLGQHNREVLHGLLGITDEAIERLAEEGVIATVPIAF